MQLLNIGGATAILEHNGKRMLFDPWLDDGIFHGSWYHFPPSRVAIPDLGHLDYLYISHIHEDHCSAGTIKHLNKDAEVIIMDRQPNFVDRFLDGHGFRFARKHLVKARTPVQLAPGLTVDIVEPDPADEMARMIDSALVIVWDGFVVFNANDCLPHADGLRYVRETYGKVDLALLPYSGGSGYPACYLNLSAAEKAAEKRRIMDMRLANFVDAVKTLEPKYAMPFADQYLVAGSRADLNKFISHPPCGGAVLDPMRRAGLESSLVMLNSGQRFDIATGTKTPSEPYRHFSEEDREAYIQTLDVVQYDHEKVSFNPSVPLDRLVGYARARLWDMQQARREVPAFSFYLETSDTHRRFHIPLDANKVTSVALEVPMEQPYLMIRAPHDLMIMLLLGHVSWNIADAALFLDYERKPNHYDPRLYALLNLLRV